MISVSPICRYHCIFVPLYNSGIPEYISSTDHIIPILQLLSENDRRDAKVYFNGYNAGASVNHLHYQMFYSNELLNDEIIAIECAKNNTILKLLNCNTFIITIYENNSFFIPFFKISTSSTTAFDLSIISEISKIIFNLLRQFMDQVVTLIFYLLIMEELFMLFQEQDAKLYECQLLELEHLNVVDWVFVIQKKYIINVMKKSMKSMRKHME